MKLPQQPLYFDKENKLRFRGNKIVRYMLDAGFTDLDKLAAIPFKQFFQLLGFDLVIYSEFHDGGSVSQVAWDRTIVQAHRTIEAEDIPEWLQKEIRERGLK